MLKKLSKYKFSLASAAIVVAIVGIVGLPSVVAAIVYAGLAGLILGGVVLLGAFFWVAFEIARYIFEKTDPRQ